MILKQLVDKNSVILIGNGINQYNLKSNSSINQVSWHAILMSMLKEYELSKTNIPDMYPFTEIFEIIKSNKNLKDKVLKKSFAFRIEQMKHSAAHKRLIDFCEEYGIDILTTNFDHTLENVYNFVIDSEISRKRNFTRWYPWNAYYTLTKGKRDYPRIWHIQGDIQYVDSLKLTVHDYNRSMNHFNKYNPSKEKSMYYTIYSWVNIFFEKKLVIFGLALEEQEFFLRHMLYLKSQMRINKNEIIGYFIYAKEDSSLYDTSGLEKERMNRLRFFAEAIGLQMIEVKKYSDIYEFD